MSHIPRIPNQDDRDDGSSVYSFRRPPSPSPPPPPASEPAIMVPAAVVVCIAILTLVQLGRETLSFQEDFQVLLWLAFIPARYSAEWTGFPGGLAADVWTFVTYALLHGSWTHLISNAIWLVAFGAAVARRFGALRFWLFSIASAAGGAGLHLAFHFGEEIPVVGASAAVAGLMAGACRFVFDGGGPLRMRRGGDDAAYRLPARGLVDTFRNKSAVAFIAIFFGINLAIGLGGSAMAGGVSIAWEAHLGGFLVGLLAFRLFDPVRR